MGTGMQVTFNIAHCLLRHRTEYFMRKTAKELGWVLMCSMHVTLPEGKGWTKKIKKKSVVEKELMLRYQFCLDLSKVTINSETIESIWINQDNWRIMVCKATGQKWSNLVVMMSDMNKHHCQHLNKTKSQYIPDGCGTYGWSLLVKIISWQSTLGVLTGYTIATQFLFIGRLLSTYAWPIGNPMFYQNSECNDRQCNGTRLYALKSCTGGYCPCYSAGCVSCDQS